MGEGGESWPLALDPYSSNRNSHTFRTVLCCRVHRQLSIEGAPYLLLRIAGASFVLHQIRHMVGTAIAVAQGVVPVEAVHTALKTPLKVGTAPNPEPFRELDVHARLSSSLTHLSLSLAWLHVKPTIPITTSTLYPSRNRSFVISSHRSSLSHLHGCLWHLLSPSQSQLFTVTQALPASLDR